MASVNSLSSTYVFDDMLGNTLTVMQIDATASKFAFFVVGYQLY